ncbi:MAG: SGNH/GDSL hydrolase family protein [Lachnospiraceae bacterium]|nr:SGNH/GDSL hydrolase family protein [Lachnospiraceae bacterium]
MQNEYKIDYNKGLVETGSSKRTGYIKKLFDRAKAGEDITVGFLGGSITQGSVATDDTLCYAYRVYDWFVKTFPKSHITYVNAGIGATDSEYAAARLSEHLLSKKPDFVLMEFSVNDECNDHYLETYEGAVRQILNSKPDIAFMLMNNVFYNDGASAERIHRVVARHYGLPSVSMRTTIFDAILAGNFEKAKITPDDLHPNDDGHGLVAGVITTYLESVLSGKTDGAQALDSEMTDGSQSPDDKGTGLPAPISLNRYERSVKYDNRNSEPVLKKMSGFTRDETPRTAVRDCFKEGFIATEKGSFAEYEVTGSCIAVQFRRTINLPAPVAKVTVDGNEDTAVILDANFDETWGDKLVLTDIYMSENAALHKIRLEIIETHPDDKGDFYLAGVIVSG